MPGFRFSSLPQPESVLLELDDCVTYFDSSALVKLLSKEEDSDVAALLWDGATRPTSSVLTYSEVRAALASARRNQRFTNRTLTRAKEDWEVYWSELRIVDATLPLVTVAGDLAETYRLRGYDAVHLASALYHLPSLVIMVTWDRRLREAALSAGLGIAPD